MRPLLPLAVLVLLPLPASALGLLLPNKGTIRLQEIRVFLTWDPVEKKQAITLQPILEGNAEHFAWIVATPVKPRLDEMPRDVFRALAAVTLLGPMDGRFAGAAETPPFRFPPPPDPKKSIVVIIDGLPGSSDYWVMGPKETDRIRQWPKDHGYDPAPIAERVVPLMEKGWHVTILKEDALRFKRDKSGHFRDAPLLSAIRFAYATERPHLPVGATHLGGKDAVPLVLYIAAPSKLDLPGEFSFQPAWLAKWTAAIKSLPPRERKSGENDWLEHVTRVAPDWRGALHALAKTKRPPTALHFAKRLSDEDHQIMQGKKPFPHEAPADVVRDLRNLAPHVKLGDFVLKLEMRLRPEDLTPLIELTPAQVADRPDALPYDKLLPAP